MTFSALARAARRALPALTRLVSLLAPLALGAAIAYAAPLPTLTPEAPPQPQTAIWQAILLGLVQGLTEFIPVSSSAHLNITHAILGQPRELTFDVFLHIGTTAALIWYFRHDWKELLTIPRFSRLRNLVFIACVPAAFAGLLLRKLEDNPPFSLIWFNATMLAIAGAVLFISDKVGTQERSLERITLRDAVIIGSSQALALIPGVSRSGSTLTAGLFLGLQREDAARFSFLMSLPITLGAISFEFYGVLKKGLGTVNAAPLTIVIGILTAGISGLWAIGFLLNYLKTKDVTPFFVWRVAVAVLVFGLLLSGLVKQ